MKKKIDWWFLLFILQTIIIVALCANISKRMDYERELNRELSEQKTIVKQLKSNNASMEFILNGMVFPDE